MTIDHALQCVKLGASDGYAAVLADEVRRLNTCLQWEQNRSGRIGTHGYDCWQWGPAHYECALGEIKRLREALRSQREWWRNVPSGVDIDADIDHPCPGDDMAWRAGCAIREIDKALRGGEE